MSMYIEPKAFVGKKFTALDPNLEYECVGYAANETFLVIGSQFAPASNRSTLKTFKLSDVSFKGELSVHF